MRAAIVEGAWATTLANGSTVSANLYAAKDLVYVSNGSGDPIKPNGNYYFMVTDSSGTQLLSSDDIKCRVIKVSDGKMNGVPADTAGGYGTPACYHTKGVTSSSKTPVQLAPYADTPNQVGGYKVWFTPVANYNPSSCPEDRDRKSFGFCTSASKTLAFTVTASAPKAAHVSVCAFNDLNGDGWQDTGELLMPHWPVTASGVDGGTVSAQTGDEGCVSFAYSGFATSSSTQFVTLEQGTFGPDWQPTAPGEGTTTIMLHPGDSIQAPDFGDTNPYCPTGCSTNTVILTATTFPSLTRAFGWNITKTVDHTQVKTAGGPATFNYTVTMQHDAGVESAWQTTGMIRLSNPGNTAIDTIAVTSAVDNGGTCVLTGGATVSIPAGSHDELPYRCDYTGAPAPGTVTVAATWSTYQTSASTSVDFATAVVSAIDGSAVVDDTRQGRLGTVTSADTNPVAFTYAKTFDGVPGQCTTITNTASFTTDTTATTRASSQDVDACVHALRPATVTVTPVTATYSATAHGTTCAVSDGFDGTLSYSGVAPTVYGPVADAPTAAGTYLATCDFAGDMNNDAVSGSAAVTITPAPLTITASSVSLTYGDAVPEITAQFDGFVGDETAAALLTAPRCTTSYTTTSGAGTRRVTICYGARSDNYKFRSVLGTVTIAKKAVTATTAPVTATYTGTPHGTTCTISDGLTGTLTYADQTPVKAGVYTATCAFAGDENHLSATASATITITPAPLSVMANNTTRSYLAADPSLDGVLTGVMTGDAITATYRSTGTGARVPGAYAIVPALADPTSTLANYTVTITNGTLTITNATPVCTVATPSRSLLWPPNHKWTPITINGVTDADGGAITIKILSIFQDEATDSNGDGDTSVDGKGLGTGVAYVRAERVGDREDDSDHRDGDRCEHERGAKGHKKNDSCEHERDGRNKVRGNGRVYHITFTAADSLGASCTGEVTVGVPHDQGRHATPVDDGALYDSTRVTLPAGHGKGDGCEDGDHEKGRKGSEERHGNGDKCDHELGKNGHKRNDGCEHERNKR